MARPTFHFIRSVKIFTRKALRLNLRLQALRLIKRRLILHPFETLLLRPTKKKMWANERASKDLSVNGDFFKYSTFKKMRYLILSSETACDNS